MSGEKVLGRSAALSATLPHSRPKTFEKVLAHSFGRSFCAAFFYRGPAAWTVEHDDES